MQKSPNMKFYAGLALAIALSGCGGGDSSTASTTSGDTMLANSTGVGNNTTGSTTTGGTTTTGTTSTPTYCQDGIYPAQWEWDMKAPIRQAAAPATEGTPKIEQVRNGVVIATYTTLGGDGAISPTNQNVTDGQDTRVGPFRRSSYLQWLPGDTFLVYPAVYKGRDMQIYLGPNSINYADVLAGRYVVPENITIRGVTVDGKRPVIVNPPTTNTKQGGASLANYNNSLIYVEGKLTDSGTTLVKQASNITIENIDVVDAPDGGYIGKAAVYISGVHNITLRNMRISGFRQHKVNGIFGAANYNSGTLKLENVELADNGGDSGPEHNAYINASTIDPQFTFHVVGSYSHGAYYGHELKSRAQRTIIEGSYLAGKRADATMPQTEAYLLDIPNGGTAIVRNNIFVKNYSGNNSNGASLTFGVEPTSDGRPQDLTAEHNTFVALSKYYDTQSHPLFPMYIGSSVTNKRVSSNVFVGYCKANNATKDYRGENYSELTFADIDQTYRPLNPSLTGISSIVGSPAYQHKSTFGKRTTYALGARD